MTEINDRNSYILGLDLGTESLGWALIDLRDGAPAGVRHAGVHRFNAGVEGDYESGRDESRAKVRRDARQPRRQHWRRAWRRRRILRILQRAGLLPPGAIETPAQIHEYLLAIDAQLRQGHTPNGDRTAAHLLPYHLRSRALDAHLTPHELGRALYHLAARRGFLSNRKAKRRDENAGQVKEAIGQLREAMQDTGARTIGEYFASLDPETERVRARWTARDMFTSEFEAIWEAQRTHHPDLLTDDLHKNLRHAMFFQRPLKSQRHLVGHCDLMPERKRAALALRIAQRFRILQKVNDLELTPPDGPPRPLEQTERDTLFAALDAEGDRTFTQVKRLLKLPRETRFNLEEGGEKRICGNRTDAALRKVFGDRWDELSETQRDQVVEDVLSIEKEDALIRRAKRYWNLNQEQAEALADITLEEDFARHCCPALELLVARMADGTQYGTARKREFPERFVAAEPIDSLPPVREAVPDLNNPAVIRALTELRKLINEIIRRHGKPERIHIELARDLKQSRKRRKEASNRIKANRDRREDAQRRILAEMQIPSPSRRDVEKVLLADECDWICPYTGRSINMRTLLGANPQFDIEHIWPFSRSLDNSFANKTLCYHEENRTRKRNLTPHEAYAADERRWHEITERVRRFRGDFTREKLRRFYAEELPEDFLSRQLNETRYISRLAAEFLSLLYGGRSDAEHKQRIFVNTGRVTAYLRNEWDLNQILGDGGMKSRNDHRHHAVDAIAIAICGPTTVKALADAADRAPAEGRRLFGQMTEPWPGFLDDVRRVVLGDADTPLSGILVSMWGNRRLNGPLHRDTFYSKPITTRSGDTVRHVRKALHKLTVTDLKKDLIVDPVVRARVTERWQELGGGNSEKLFADPNNHPTMLSGDGREIPIHKVRVRASVKPWSVGQKARRRWVVAKAGSNHHTTIVATIDENGTEVKWEDHIVSRFDATDHLVRARRSGNPPTIVQRDWGPDRRFKFSLAPDDYLLMDDDDGRVQLYRVASISEGDLELRLHSDARIRKEINAAHERVRASAEKLRQRNARKVRITYLGEVLPAND